MVCNGKVLQTVAELFGAYWAEHINIGELDWKSSLSQSVKVIQGNKTKTSDKKQNKTNKTFIPAVFVSYHLSL